jgi:hypothetical protein
VSRGQAGRNDARVSWKLEQGGASWAAEVGNTLAVPVAIGESELVRQAVRWSAALVMTRVGLRRGDAELGVEACA